jgi:hypothetical protein
MGEYNTPLWNRYGHWSDMASYQRVAQAGGYEVTRALFEAYIGNSKDPENPSTGLIYWMMNKAWPSLQWEFYGSDFDQAGVYFGAKKAGEPVHAIYAYGDGSVRVANLSGDEQSGIRARAEFIDLDGSTKATHTVDVPALASQDVATVLHPGVPDGISTTYFLRLTLTRGSHVVSRNVYWLSTKPDRVDYDQTLGEGFGAVFEPDGYADLTGLQCLAPRRCESTRRPGSTVGARSPVSPSRTCRIARCRPSSYGRTYGVGPRTDGRLRATTRCCRFAGATTTSRCGPASARR